MGENPGTIPDLIGPGGTSMYISIKTQVAKQSAQPSTVRVID
jgi:hypothetical protein